MAAESPSPTAEAASPRPSGVRAPDGRVFTPRRASLRGLNKPKCSKYGNSARSRCPFESCKKCCSSVQNPCHIHVLKRASILSIRLPNYKSTSDKSAIILPASGSYVRLTSPRLPTVSTDSHSICDSGASSASRPLSEVGTFAASISTPQSGNNLQILKSYISGVIKQGLSDLKRASLQESFKIREALLQYLGIVSSLKISFPKLQSFLEGLPKDNNINSHSDVLQWTSLQGELKGRIAVNSQKVTDLVEAKNESEKELSQVVEQITQLQAKEASIRNNLATQKAKINAAKLEVKLNEEALQAISSKLEAAVALVALSSQVDAQFRSEVSSFIFDE